MWGLVERRPLNGGRGKEVWQATEKRISTTFREYELRDYNIDHKQATYIPRPPVPLPTTDLWLAQKIPSQTYRSSHRITITPTGQRINQYLFTTSWYIRSLTCKELHRLCAANPLDIFAQMNVMVALRGEFVHQCPSGWSPPGYLQSTTAGQDTQEWTNIPTLELCHLVELFLRSTYFQFGGSFFEQM